MEFIDFKDFVFTATNSVKNFVTDSIKGTGIKICTKIGIAFDEERFEKWIKQALEIESFSKEQIEDVKIRKLIDDKDEEIRQLKLELEVIKTVDK